MNYLKVKGTWKPVTDAFIKAGGKWLKSVDNYIKVGGTWHSSTDLPSKKFEYDGTVATLANKSRVLVNKLDSKTMSAPIHASNHIDLTGIDQSFDIPLNVVLGSELIIDSSFDDPSKWEKQHGWTVSGGQAIFVTGSGPGSVYQDDNEYVVGRQYRVLIDVPKTSTSPIGLNVRIGSAGHYILTNGIHEFTLTAVATTAIRITALDVSEVIINSISVKEITSTTTTKTLLLYNPVDKEYQAIADGSVGKELVENGDFSDGANGWVLPSGFTIDTNSMSILTPTSITGAYTSKAAEVGKRYKAKFDLLDFVKGGVSMRIASAGSSTFRANGTYTFESTSANTNALFQFRSAGDTKLSTDNVYVKEILPNSSTYNITTPFSQLLKLDFVITQTQLDYLNSNVDALQDIWTGRNLHPTLGIVKADFKGYWTGADYASGADVYDLVSGTSITIQNYTASCRDTYHNVDFGATDLPYEKDGSGRLTGTHGAMLGGTDGRYLMLPLIDQAKQKYLVKDCLTYIKGDVTQFTVTKCTP